VATERSLPVIKTVDACIYCGSGDGLTDEHIIPLGLGGNLVFPKASCLACNKVTSRFEERVLRGHMSEVRAVANLPTRRKKKRPTSVRTEFIQADGSRKHVDVPLPGAAAFMLLPAFAPAARIYGLPAVQGMQISAIDTIGVGQDLITFAAKNDAVGVAGKVRLEAHAFCQMLCKIAYSYYVATTGQIAKSESPALAVLLGSEQNSSNWLGSRALPLSPLRTKSLHLIEAGTRQPINGIPIEVVTIQLFSNAGDSTFEVVVQAKGWESWSEAN
jgi:hypothetical protein